MDGAIAPRNLPAQTCPQQALSNHPGVTHQQQPAQEQSSQHLHPLTTMIVATTVNNNKTVDSDSTHQAVETKIRRIDRMLT